MIFHALLQQALSQPLGESLSAFRPELTLCAAIVLILLVRMLAPRWKAGPYYVMLFGAAAALYLVIPAGLPFQAASLKAVAARGPMPLFTGLLVYDSFSVSLRGLLLLFVLLLVLLTRISALPRAEDAAEFYVMVLGATLGMCLMVSANHALVIVLGIEMASVPSYVLAGILRHRRRSSEAALKYAVFGAGAAGVMLYGISLLAGAGHRQPARHGRRSRRHVPRRRPGRLHRGAGAGRADAHGRAGFQDLGRALSLLGSGRFEGAPAEVAAFLSVASKAAALGLLARLALMFSTACPQAGLYIAGLVGLLAAVTCTFGNLAAYGQSNMKRLLAYSTIAHAGYMMMPVAAAATLAARHDDAARGQPWPRCSSTWAFTCL